MGFHPSIRGPPDLPGSETDLAVTIEEMADPVLTDAEAVYSIRVSNRGAATATGVVVTNVIPPGMELVSAASMRPLTISGNQVIAHLGRVRQTGCAEFQLVLRAQTEAVYTNAVSLIADQFDPAPFDNTAAQATTIVEQPPKRTIFLGNASQPWTAAANWSQGVPRLGDTAVIPANRTANLPADIAVARLELGGTLNGPGSILVTVAGEWTGGNREGPGGTRIAPGAILNISGDDDKGFFYHTLDNAGTIRWSGAGLFRGHSAPVLNNFGIVEISSDAALTRFNSPAIFNNAGVVRKTGSALQSLEVAFNNIGRFELNSGKVEFTASFSNRNEVLIGPGSELRLAHSSGNRGYFHLGTNSLLTCTVGNHFLENDTVIEGDGFFRITGNASVSMDGTRADNIQLDAGTLLGDGRLTISKMFSWTGGIYQGYGVTRIDPGARLDIQGSAAKGLYWRTLENAGTIRWEGSGAINGHSAPVIDNLDKGIFEIATDAPLTRFNSPALLNNAGLLRKTGEGPMQQLELALHNTGRFQIESGRVEFMSTFSNRNEVLLDPRGELLITGASGSSQGRFEIAAEALLTYAGGNHNFEPGTTVEGDGALRINSNNTTLLTTGTLGIQNIQLEAGTFGGDGAVSISGTFLWTGGIHQGYGTTILQPGAVMNIDGSSPKSLYWRTIDNAGAIHWNGTGAINGHSKPILNNLPSGLITASSDAPLNRFNSAAIINNAGRFLKTGGTGSKRMDVVFNNSGLLDLQSGILSLVDQFIPASNSVLRVTLAGSEPGTGFARLELAAALDLAGRLEVATAGSFIPSSDATFAIITTPFRRGTFSATSSQSLLLNPIYAQTSVAVGVRLAPRLETAAWINGRFRLSHRGTPGQAYDLEGSTDLRTWTPLSRGTYPPGGPIEFVDPDSSNALFRFYRLLVTPSAQVNGG